MKTAIGIVVAFALALSVVPAVAGDTFHALRALPTPEQATLTPLPDDQLAAIEGKQVDLCVACFAVNTATVAQVNIATLSNALQANVARVEQEAEIN
jgi:hypothetical protein